MEKIKRSFLLKLLIFIIVYYIVGRLALKLSVPPGMASPIWPGAGIALGCVLVGGYRYLLGIFIGSCLVSIFPADYTFSSISLVSIWIPISIAIGVALQAWLGRYLICYVVRLPTLLEREKDVGAILLLGGVVSCIIGASFGAITLLQFGLISNSGFLMTWMNWWVGDTLGVFIFTPIVLLFSKTGIVTSTKRKYFIFIPLLILIVLVVAVFSISRDIEKRLNQEAFSRQASYKTHALESKVIFLTSVLDGIKGLFEASEFVTRDEFQMYTKRYLSDPCIQALEWIPKVPYSQLQQYEIEARKGAYPGFKVLERGAEGLVEASKRSYYFPVYYLEPYEGNEKALGFDVGSNRKRREAMHQALMMNKLVATEGVSLVQGGEFKQGVLMFNPVFGVTNPPLISKARFKTLKGYVVGVFKFQDLIDSTLINLDRSDVDIYIYESRDGKENDALYGKRTESPMFKYTDKLDMGGHNWILELTPTPHYIKEYYGWESWGVLIGGFLVISALEALLLIVTARTETVTRLVEEKTTQIEKANRDLDQAVCKLQESNEELEHFAHIVSHDLKAPLRTILGFNELLKEKSKQNNDDESLRFLKLSESAAKGMDDLIVDLLEYSKASRMDRKLEEVDAQDCFNGAINNLHDIIEEARADVNADNLPQVKANRVLLTRLLQNLIGNAIKYCSNDRTPKVSLTAYQKDNYWYFVLKDNGIGIDEDFCERIFEPFTRLHATQKYQGTGIGLAICMKIVEGFGGKIWVESTLGEGSVFYFTIPV